MSRKNAAGTHGRRPFAEMVDSLIAKSMKNLREKNMKATVADLIRAIEMEREMFPQQGTSAEIIWVDPWD
jgi:hypothetical protein